MKFVKKIKETYKVVGVVPKKFQTGVYGQTLYLEKRGDKLFIILQKNDYDVTKWKDKLVPKDVEWEKHGNSEYFEEDYKFEWEIDDGRVHIYDADKNFPEEILDLKPTGKTFPLLRDILEDDFTASWQSDVHDYMEGMREFEAERQADAKRGN